MFIVGTFFGLMSLWQCLIRSMWRASWGKCCGDPVPWTRVYRNNDEPSVELVCRSYRLESSSISIVFLRQYIGRISWLSDIALSWTALVMISYIPKNNNTTVMSHPWTFLGVIEDPTRDNFAGYDYRYAIKPFWSGFDVGKSTKYVSYWLFVERLWWYFIEFPRCYGFTRCSTIRVVTFSTFHRILWKMVYRQGSRAYGR